MFLVIRGEQQQQPWSIICAAAVAGVSQREAAPGPPAQHLIAQEMTTQQDFSLPQRNTGLGEA